MVDATVDPFALSLPSQVPFHTSKGYTLRVAKQVLLGAWTQSLRLWNVTFAGDAPDASGGDSLRQ